jgi:hypothetical protein
VRFKNHTDGGIQPDYMAAHLRSYTFMDLFYFFHFKFYNDITKLKLFLNYFIIKTPRKNSYILYCGQNMKTEVKTRQGSWTIYTHKHIPHTLFSNFVKSNTLGLRF